MYLSPFFYFR